MEACIQKPEQKLEQKPEQKPSRKPREHHWDWLRASLMLLGVPYHVFMSYRAVQVGTGQAWIVNSGEGGAVYTVLADFIHLFRMPAFFIVAGYFAALLLVRKNEWTWLRGRFVRLGVPFLTCLLLINPLMNLATELSNFGLKDAWASFLHNSATSGGYWMRHLWFIIVLLYCCSAAAMLAAISPVLKQGMLPARVDALLARYFVPFILAIAIGIGLWEAFAVELFYEAGLATKGAQQIFRLDELIQYAPWFMVGLLLARAPHFRAIFYRPSYGVAVVALGAVYVSLAYGDRMEPMMHRFIAAIAALALSQGLIALAKRFTNGNHPFVDRLVDASFVIYLVHMPIIVVLVVIGQQIAMPLIAKVTLITLLALVLSYAIWAVMRRSALATFLLDGRVPAAPAGGRVNPPSRALCHDKRCDLRPSLP